MVDTRRIASVSGREMENVIGILYVRTDANRILDAVISTSGLLTYCTDSKIWKLPSIIDDVLVKSLLESPTSRTEGSRAESSDRQANLVLIPI